MPKKQEDWIQLGVKVSPEHLKMVDEAAEELGMTRASFVRFALLRQTRLTIAETQPRLYREEDQRVR